MAVLIKENVKYRKYHKTDIELSNEMTRIICYEK